MPKEKVNGALFKNGKKEKKTHPDYTGLANIDAEFARELYNRCRDAKNGEIRINISAWLKEAKDGGKPYMSLNFDFPREGGKSRDDDDRGRSKSRDDDDRGRSKSRDDFSDEIPF